MRSALFLWIPLLVAASLGGCSLAWTQSVDRFVPPNPPLCEPDVVSPSLDVIVTAVLTTAAVSYVLEAPRAASRVQGAIGEGAVAAAFAASGAVGFVRLSQCMDAQTQYRFWLRDNGLLTDGQQATPSPRSWLNPPAQSKEDLAERDWQEEQERRFAAERVAHVAALEQLRQAHPLQFATLRLRNEAGDSNFAVRVSMEDTEEVLQTLDPQPLAAHAEGLYAQALQARADVPAEISLVVHAGPSETVFSLDSKLHPGGTLQVTFAWDAATGRFAVQQAWDPER